MEINTTQDIINVEDLTLRLEELEDTLGELADPQLEALIESGNDEAIEYKAILDALADMEGCGGDVQWRGSWYPSALIRDSYFRDYAQELAEECGLLKNATSWPLNCIDWDQAVNQLQHDYTYTTIGDSDYWYRNC